VRRQRVDPGTSELLPLLIGIAFGLVFLVANRGPGAPWPAIVLVVGVAATAVDLVLLVVYARRPERAALRLPTVMGGRRYGIVVAAEVVALAASDLLDHRHRLLLVRKA